MLFCLYLPLFDKYAKTVILGVCLSTDFCSLEKVLVLMLQVTLPIVEITVLAEEKYILISKYLQTPHN